MTDEGLVIYLSELMSYMCYPPIQSYENGFTEAEIDAQKWKQMDIHKLLRVYKKTSKNEYDQAKIEILMRYGYDYN